MLSGSTGVCLRLHGMQVEVRKLLEVAPTSILATELEYLKNQQSELTVLDKYDSLNAACANCSCASQRQL